MLLYVTFLSNRELVSRVKLCLVSVFPDIIKDCPKIRNLLKIFLRRFENVVPERHYAWMETSDQNRHQFSSIDLHTIQTRAGIINVGCVNNSRQMTRDSDASGQKTHETFTRQVSLAMNHQIWDLSPVDFLLLPRQWNAAVEVIAWW